jgi:hypothetical protein
MNKKLLAVAVAVAMSIPSVAVLAAEKKGAKKEETQVKISGSARVRALSKHYADDLDDKTDYEQDKYYDQRVRIKVDATAAGGSKLHTRFTVSEGKFNGTANTRTGNGTTTTTTAVTDDGGNTHDQTTTTATNGIQTDYAYISVPVGPGTLDAGLQMANWGNCLLVCDSQRDRIKYTLPLGGGMKVSIFTDKVVELSSVDAEEGMDYDATSVAFVLPALGGQAGILYTSQNQRDGDNAGTKAEDGVSGSTLDLFLKGKIGNIGLMAELVQKSGEVNETANMSTDDGDQKGPSAMFAGANIPLGGMSLMAGVITTNRFTTDDDFASASMFSQFGGDGDMLGVWGGSPTTSAGGAAMKGAADKTTGLILGLTMPVGPGKLSVNLALGTYDYDDADVEANDDDNKANQGAITATELQYNMNVNASTTLKAFYGLTKTTSEYDADNQTLKDIKDSTHSAMGAKLQVEF